MRIDIRYILRMYGLFMCTSHDRLLAMVDAWNGRCGVAATSPSQLKKTRKVLSHQVLQILGPKVLQTLYPLGYFDVFSSRLKRRVNPERS